MATRGGKAPPPSSTERAITMNSVVLPIAAVALAYALGIAILIIWSIKRHRDPRLHISCDAPFNELMPSLAGLTHGIPLKGNAVEILEDGAFFEALLEEISRATRSVHFETFLWKDGQIGTRLVEALEERSRAGVTVRVLVDATGGKQI